MRLSSWTPVVLSLAFAAFALAPYAGLWAQDDEEELTAERIQIAKEALEASVARGKELWVSPDLGKKTCASCHEDPEKPDLNMATREWSYPAYSRRKRKVVTLQQKINEMLKFQSRGKEFDLESEDAAALAAYVMSLRAK